MYNNIVLLFVNLIEYMSNDKKIKDKEADLKELKAIQNESELMRSIMDDMKDLFCMLTVKMRQFGIPAEDLEEIIQDQIIGESFHQHPLIKTSRAYTKLAAKFLDEFLYEQQRMLHQFNIEVSLDDVHEEIEIISSHHLIMVSKCWNFLQEINNKRKNNSADKIYYLIKQSLDESKSAIKSFDEKRQHQQSSTAEMLKLLGQLQTEIDKLK